MRRKPGWSTRVTRSLCPADSPQGPRNNGNSTLCSILIANSCNSVVRVPLPLWNSFFFLFRSHQFNRRFPDDDTLT